VGGEAVTDPKSEPPARRLPAPSSMLGRFVMGALFFCLVTPLGLVMRLAGRDPLRLRLDRAMPSYWIAREAAGGRQTSMTRQY
jgi:hypothetical protein